MKWTRWQASDFHRYLDVVFDAFGADRLLIGLDRPVCILSGKYESTMQIVMSYVQQQFPFAVRAGILGENCSRFYRVQSHRRSGPDK
jgi:L-fuconolactonase